MVYLTLQFIHEALKTKHTEVIITTTTKILRMEAIVVPRKAECSNITI